MIISFIALRTSCSGMPKSCVHWTVLTVAERGDLQTTAISPKYSPRFRMLTFLPVSSTKTVPSLTMNIIVPLSPSLNTMASFSMANNSTQSTNLSISFLLSCEKRKWLPKTPLIISWSFFYKFGLIFKRVGVRAWPMLPCRLPRCFRCTMSEQVEAGLAVCSHPMDNFDNGHRKLQQPCQYLSSREGQQIILTTTQIDARPSSSTSGPMWCTSTAWALPPSSLG